ncbi:Cysteine-rich RLK 42 [Hibiscus syriacus]|uniref:Cysteine-rich RLK 42 n=1 Tax=Hibiscus syriacus TaxID=106335 RepID=A0A6A2XE04_HIBSY|nr:Cysteine-rich RLK 42 [Hibiscus syriacus]
MYRNKFEFHEAGKPPDKLYVLSQCMDDFSSVECAHCFTRITNILQACFPSTGGRVYLDGCFIRANNYSFYRDMPITNDDVETSDDFKVVLKKNVAQDGPQGSLQKMVRLVQGVVEGDHRPWDGSVLEDLGQGHVLVQPCRRRRPRLPLHARQGRPHAQCRLSLAVAVGLRLEKMAYKQMNPRCEWKEKATDCFNNANNLVSGGYGEVFKGTLPDGREISVKRLYVNGRNRSREIYNELDVISKAQHKNLVRCLGGCFTIIDNFLVYEYLANNSLDCILFGYEVRIIHRDIKASNILLDLRFRPKIADFGLARLCSRDTDKIHLVNNTFTGTFGYMAPEYIAKGRPTEKVDVYSFGVLMLEIIG